MLGRGTVGIVSALVLQAACDRHEPPPAPPPPPVAQIREGGTEKPTRLVIGLTPFIPESDLRREFTPLIDYLSRKLSLPIDIKRAESYAAATKLFGEYQVHLAVLSPLAYVRAKQDNPGLILLATQIADGSSTYAGYIVARDDSGLARAEDLKGKRCLFIDRASASGFIYPMAYLNGLEITPETFFKSIGFSRDHEKALDAVLHRDADAAAVASTVFKMYGDKGAEGRRLRILAKTGRIPYDAYCASPRLDQALVDRVRAALLDLSTRTAEGRQVLQGLTEINGFVAVGDDHYDEVRRVNDMVNAFAPP
ncbi:MAG: phosphate/phosphite/phosphonate ABC transporter substrate-binding protein [Deltaproteobacteria bacterium]|nr:phosphate/phosphite/phosphonate ABC transporter substrate-binding protein [Deltaproteobacteria bacterium]